MTMLPARDGSTGVMSTVLQFITLVLTSRSTGKLVEADRPTSCEFE